MTTPAEIAVVFAKALVDGDFVKAHSFLSPALQREMTGEDLRREMYEMWSGYASGDAKEIHFNDDSGFLEEWPGKMPGDKAWVYVGICGDEFVEGVEVLVAEMDEKLVIREIHWGRP
jgi:hypothetical protein